MSELTPYICVADARAAITWYTDVLGATVVVGPIVMDGGAVGHVELDLDGAHWMMSDEFDSAGVAAPAPHRGAAVTLHLSTPDVDGLTRRVVDSGTPLTRGPEETPHGRIAVFTDPFGHRWMVDSPIV
ncbi:MAG: VOC family protein [Micrococcales bacterium]|uniref:VOC family protein n=1 Tax=Phycicoccus sp. TaxID=1902410 RepID=UPI001983B0A2|nr:VOC family protein [Phycicoccus sp.]MBD3783731.1 VOC family protein [Micrococcales bacterium]HMM94402.1 VOC family protein [Phycicoccus sp.]